MMKRSYSITREYSIRLQPFLQARSNARRSLLGSVSFEALSYRAPRASINLLQLGHLRKEEKKDKRQKKEVYLLVIGFFSLGFIHFELFRFLGFWQFVIRDFFLTDQTNDHWCGYIPTDRHHLFLLFCEIVFH